jgi:hypothetical protein
MFIEIFEFVFTEELIIAIALLFNRFQPFCLRKIKSKKEVVEVKPDINDLLFQISSELKLLNSKIR